MRFWQALGWIVPLWFATFITNPDKFCACSAAGGDGDDIGSCTAGGKHADGSHTVHVPKLAACLRDCLHSEVWQQVSSSLLLHNASSSHRTAKLIALPCPLDHFQLHKRHCQRHIRATSICICTSEGLSASNCMGIQSSVYAGRWASPMSAQ